MKVKANIPRGGADLPISEREEMWLGHLSEVEMAIKRKLGHRTL
jgi:hypothetical protein